MTDRPPPNSRQGHDAAYEHPFTHDGLIVSPLMTDDGQRVVYAEVVPAGSWWLPWPGRTSRWWYEVHSVERADEYGIERQTWAYTEGGSGGGFTLASCVRRACRAVCRIVEGAGDHGE